MTINLEELREWVAGGRRQVDIILGGPVGMGYESIYVYDFTLNQGQNIQDIKEIDLLRRKCEKAEWYEKKGKQLREEIAKLNEANM